jgi:hypothetical protein
MAEPNRRILHLENGQSELITVNGVPCRFIRRDLGPTQNIEFQACVNGYAAGSRGAHVAQLSFWPEHRTEPMWEVV